LDADPPAIFCTRRLKSSCLSSTSCLDKSFFDLTGHLKVESLLVGRYRKKKGSIEVALGLEFVSLDFSGHGVLRGGEINRLEELDDVNY
jgi:hypothetical protein